MKFILNKSIWAVCIAGTLLSACKEDEFIGEVAPRLFSPVNLEQIVTLTDVQVSWQSVNDAVGYTLEMAADSTFSTILASYNTTETNLVLSDLEFESKFIPRVKANASNPQMDSKYTIGASFTTPNSPVVLKPSEEVGRDYVVLTWLTDYEADLIRISKITETEDFQDYSLSAEEIEAGRKRIDGLESSISYQAVLMNNGKRYNKVSFRTKDALPAGTIEVPAGAILSEYLDSAQQLEGTSVLSLAAGAEYELPEAYTLTKDITLTCEGTVKPVIRVKELNVAGSIGTLRFENIHLTGEIVGGAYLMNLRSSEAFAGIGLLQFIDCEISDFANAILRHQASEGTGIATIEVADCLIRNINKQGSASYALFHLADKDYPVDEYKFTGTTIYNCGSNIIENRAKTTVARSTSVLIENCTISQIGNNSRYMLDFQNYASGDITLRNTIFGTTMNPTSFSGLRVPGLLLNVANTYLTSDFLLKGGAISKGTRLETSAAELFVNPLEGDFSFQPGKEINAGAPCWK